MASALGLNVGLVYVSAFAIGCFMAGLGGAIVVPTQTAVLGMGIDALILAFVVVVIGGLGSLQGALVGALIVSFVRTAGIQFFPGDRARGALSDRGRRCCWSSRPDCSEARDESRREPGLVSSEADAGGSGGARARRCWRCFPPLSASIRRNS